jgi:hypothetical protein
MSDVIVIIVKQNITVLVEQLYCLRIAVSGRCVVLFARALINRADRGGMDSILAIY